MYEIVLFIAFIPLYFLPSIIAWRHRKKQFTAIFFLNFLLGWTIFGWVGALIWAVIKEETDTAKSYKERQKEYWISHHKKNEVNKKTGKKK